MAESKPGRPEPIIIELKFIPAFCLVAGRRLLVLSMSFGVAPGVCLAARGPLK